MNSEPTAFPGSPFDLSILIVSFNTCGPLRECLHSVQRATDAASHLRTEILVVDNNSRDHSAAMVRDEFPQVQLVAARENLGFAAACNIAIRKAQGRYIVLLHADAQLLPDALAAAAAQMDANQTAGLAGGRLIGHDGAWQPSARSFPTPLHEVLLLTGLAAKFSSSSVFGHHEAHPPEPMHPLRTDWVPSTFAIIRRKVLDAVGLFDENFFLYYEQVDLCRRIRSAGYEIWYWPQMAAVHNDGKITRQTGTMPFAAPAPRLTLWRMRSMLLYFRKHHGGGAARMMYLLEGIFYRLQALCSGYSRHPQAGHRGFYSNVMASSLDQAWAETNGGRISPPPPW